MIKLNGHIVTPTIFPDGTSQVWKLPEAKVCNPDATIEWEFENEAEIIHVLQLADLCNACTAGMNQVKLYMPFLPYARQDKGINNHSTFALKTFMSILCSQTRFSQIKIIDAHSPVNATGWARVLNVLPDERIREVIDEVKPNLIVFPDAGAGQRGYNTQGVTSFNLEKKRNQETGEIEGLKTALPLDLRKLKLLIIDDICDGGKTFIEAAKLLYNLGAAEVHLYTTHGLYTKGTECLKEAGIKRIFNFKGEV
jgi:ribose-phosphate pyrophosphokinase